MAELNGNYCTFLFPEVDLLKAAGSPAPIIRRGHMYSAYAELREWKLRTKRAQFMTSPVSAPAKKAAATSSPLCRSVPDFSMALGRKENRKPAGLPPTPTHLGRNLGAPVTPPPSMARKVAQKKVGSASASSADEKRYGGGGDARKSYSCLKELKQFSAMASASMDEEARGESRWSKGRFESCRRRTATWMDY